MVAVNSPNDLTSKIGNFFDVFQKPIPNVPHISLPFWDKETQSGKVHPVPQ
jgi:hypothetical protein